MNDFNNWFNDAIIDRILNISNNFTTCEEHKELTAMAISLQYKLMNSFTEEQKKLFDDYLCLKSKREIFEDEIIYKQGLKDGNKINDFLNNEEGEKNI